MTAGKGNGKLMLTCIPAAHFPGTARSIRNAAQIHTAIRPVFFMMTSFFCLDDHHSVKAM
jgi:hypothetical protein